MTINDRGGSVSPAATTRCDAELPDNPQCAPNYHFGMLLGVDDFRTEQGFHVGHMRRHQRLLHGAGVTAGYQVTFRAEESEVRVGTGHAVDILGRDLVLDAVQCVSLPLWWLEHRGDDAYHDITTPDDATLDLDVMVCYATCLGTPVPAIAEPCAGDSADVAYARVCEMVRLTLVRAPATAPAAAARPFHLLQMWLGRIGPRTGDATQPIESDQWLLDRLDAVTSLPADEQAVARADLRREVVARAVAEMSPAPPADAADEDDLCLLLARLRDVHLKLEPDGWTVSVGSIDMGLRESLLPAAFVQALVLDEPAPQPVVAGPVIVPGGATITGSDLDLSFSQPLAPASVSAAAFAVSEFDEAAGWKPFTPSAPTYDESDPVRPTVHLALDRVPAGSLVRVTVAGTGSTPLLGATLVPAGAVVPDGDGRTLTTSIHRG